MKKLIVTLLAAMLLLSLCACAGKETKETAAPETEPGTEARTETAAAPEDETHMGLGGVQIANPFVDYDTLEEAAAQTGFELTVPETVEGYPERMIQVMDGAMLQVIWLNGEDRLFVRKAAGSEDVSGDYNVYSDVRTLTVGEREVTLQGEAGAYSLATWQANGYSYAVMADDPMSAEALTALISGIN